jgi:UDP-GlcNAc:undecaprenyl-phosphate/decaprenyl-phosphate GlcNAc-1-phosphate transferase
MNERIIISLVVIAISYLTCALLTPVARKLALFLGVVDLPDKRKSHSKPVPLLGGLAILASMILVVWGSLFWLPVLRSSPMFSFFFKSLNDLSLYVIVKPKLWALFAGAVLVAALGIIDDVKGVGFSPIFKLASQIVAAIFLLLAGVYIDLLSFAPWLSMILSVVWIVGITNSFNLLDNMDGLSSGTALICSSIFLTLAIIKGEFFIALMLSAMIGSIAGFFQFNIRGGYIFMGDGGSLLLGFLLGAVSLMSRYWDPADTSIFPILAPIIILGLPLFDTISVIVIRLRERRSIFIGDHAHLSHRLVRIGMTKRQAVYFNFLMALSIASNALFNFDSRTVRSVVALVQVAALVAMVSILMTTQAKHSDAADK